jgi:KipI family sensor histidine kinase inhibitor
MAPGGVLRVGDNSVLVELMGQAEVHRLWRALREARRPGLEEVVAGRSSVLLTFAAQVPDLAAVGAMVATHLDGPDPRPAIEARQFAVPVVYDGPDLDDVAAACGMSSAEVVRRHTSARYSVGFIGFSPGFAYLVGGDDRIRVDRLDTPRRSVAAGSVALAEGMTAVYPQSTPGGWRLIGRTDMVMFDPRRPEPSLLIPGDEVRFVAVDWLPVAAGAAEASRGAPARSPAAAAAGTGWIRVVEPGLLTTIQDTGRIGWAHLGVSRAGAADRTSAALANRLVGNPVGAALLETTMIGPRLLIGTDRRVAVTGARADVTVDGLPARQGTPLSLRAGAVLAVGRHRAGVRSYIAFAGGVGADAVLGSRSTDTLSGLGPPPLSQGDEVPLGPPLATNAGGLPRRGSAGPAADPGDLIEVAGRFGPRQEWLSAEGRRLLLSSLFSVDPSSDRTGVRLSGPVVPRRWSGGVVSEGMVPGAVQLPPSGLPIVLMRNHPPTGGYPVVAVIDASGIDLLAQAGPDTKVRFRLH